jgi:hypothetical protein
MRGREMGRGREGESEFLHDIKVVVILLQVDGPTHFLATAAPATKGGRGRRERGATRLKRRLLERAGWRVATVLYWEWDEAALGGPAGEQAYLERLLGQYGAPTTQHAENALVYSVLYSGSDISIWLMSLGR